MDYCDSWKETTEMNDETVYKHSLPSFFTAILLKQGRVRWALGRTAGLMFAFSSMYMMYSSAVYWEYAVVSTLQPLLNKKQKSNLEKSQCGGFYFGSVNMLKLQEKKKGSLCF